MSEYKPSSTLDFNQGFAQPNAALDFGSDNASHVLNATICLPVPKLLVQLEFIVKAVELNAALTLTLPNIDVLVSYDSDVYRYIAALGNIKQEAATRLAAKTNLTHENTERLMATTAVCRETAASLKVNVATSSQPAKPYHSIHYLHTELATTQAATAHLHNEQAKPLATQHPLNSEVARYVDAQVSDSFEPMQQLASDTVIDFETAAYVDDSLAVVRLIAVWLVNNHGLHNETARVVPYGTGFYEHKPDGYTPSALLNFSCKWAAPDSRLNFGSRCQPKPKAKFFIYDEVIFVSNAVSLVDLSTNKTIPILSGDVSIDNRSFTWTLNANIAYNTVIADGALVELTINSHVWRFITSPAGKSETFGKTGLKITGKSQAVLLAYPATTHRGQVYAQATSAVQIVQAELDRVGGFSFDWQLVNNSNGWNVPANAYSYTHYTPINAIQDVASAGGGFVNAHPKDKQLIVKSDYPTAKWRWEELTPQVVIPPSLILSQDSSPDKKINYNGVYVSGDKMGVTGFVKRTGTNGAITPNQVVHSLMTEQSVAIHRGICELSQAGTRYDYDVTTPLHSDLGLLTPSDMVSLRGQTVIVRGVSIGFATDTKGALTVRKRLRLEG